MAIVRIEEGAEKKKRGALEKGAWLRGACVQLSDF